jgi:hypothetical protein
LDVQGFEDSDKIKKLKTRLTGVKHCVCCVVCYLVCSFAFVTHSGNILL